MQKHKLFVALTVAAIALCIAACDPMNLAQLPKDEAKVVVEKDIETPMPDGVKLVGDLYHPVGEGPWAVLVNRLPYGVKQMDRFARHLASTGYAVFVQDTRGRYRSGGGGDKFMPFVSEEADGRATIAWVKKQSWCNGKIAVWGGSYHGYTQWALAPDNTDIQAMVPMITTADLYKFHYKGGALRLQMMLGWGISNEGRKTEQFAGNPKKGFWKLPLIEADDAGRADWPWWDMVLEHPVKDKFWAPFDFSTRIGQVSAPALFISGWYDILNTGLIWDFEKWQSRGPGAPKARLIVGPWNHVFYNTNLKNVDWSWKEAGPLLSSEISMWFDRWLKDKKNGIDEKKPIHIFVMGENKWRDLDVWPPKEAEPLSFFMHSEGSANTSAGNGTLSNDEPAEGEADDAFDYDPKNPVPTKGGQGLLPWDAGPADQAQIEERGDVLVYSTGVLKEPVIAIGPVKVELYASSSAVDTDFTAKLVDVYPDGKAIIVADGILRGRYPRTDESGFLEPGKVYQWNIDLGYTAIMLKPGHIIRLEISSSNFPRFDRNLNSGESLANGTKIIVAHQKVLHNAQYPSKLILYVVKE